MESFWTLMKGVLTNLAVALGELAFLLKVETEIRKEDLALARQQREMTEMLANGMTEAMRPQGRTDTGTLPVLSD